MNRQPPGKTILHSCIVVQDSTVDTVQIWYSRTMKLHRYSENPILSKNPDHSWEAGSVLNPSVLYEDGIFKMYYRATNDTRTGEAGGYMSSIGLATSTDGIHFQRFEHPVLSPDRDYEALLGCEDPRVTKIDDEYFMYYTAVGGDFGKWRVRIALATSKDGKEWHKHGVVGPKHTMSKAACVFPEKIHGHYHMFYTWQSDDPISSIMHAKFDSLDEVKHPPSTFMAQNIDQYAENVVFKPPHNTYRGAEVGAVPIKTEKGWLFIYCPANTKHHPEWTINAALLDLDNPKNVLATTEQPILHPETDAEKEGVVNNVTFPEGAVIVGDELYVYYGSGDQGICLATCNVYELLDHLESRR